MRRHLWILLSIVVGMVLCLPGCSIFRSSSDERVPKPVTEDGLTLDWGKDVKVQALAMIHSAKQFCYLDMYELSDSDILNALREARRRGVDVRVILDATEPHSVQTGLPTLEKDGVSVHALPISRGISHIKMLVTEQHVLMGGMNYGAESWSNNDASVYIEHPGDSFRSLFLWDYERATGRGSGAPSVSLPLTYDRDIKEKVLKAISSATTHIAMEAFDLTDKDVLNALINASHHGVTVEVLLDPSQKYNRTSGPMLTSAGATVRFYKPYGNELMHAKLVDIDNGKMLVIGSANFSHQAYTYNHEGDLVFTNVPQFDKAIEENLTIQLGRGTEKPKSTHTYTSQNG